MPESIALTGLARSGKDSVAARLVEKHGYVRVAFADPLKEMALRIDPMIDVEPYTDTSGYAYADDWRLAEAVAEYGWEQVKDLFPEVRRFLQHLGQSVREADPEFWIRLAQAKIYRARLAGRPVVVTDVRYRNEARSLSSIGFQVVRVERPGIVAGEGAHVSETEMAGYPVDGKLRNSGDLDDLNRAVDALIGYQTSPIRAIDPAGCGCTECIVGEYVPQDQATPEQLTAMRAGLIRDNT